MYRIHPQLSFTGNYIVSIEKCNANGKRGLVFINQLICWYLFWSFFQDDKSRVEIFKEYAKKNKESVWVPFLHLLNRDDRFIVNQVINSLISQSSPESGAISSIFHSYINPIIEVIVGMLTSSAIDHGFEPRSGKILLNLHLLLLR